MHKNLSKINWIKRIGFLAKRFDGINFHKSFKHQITSILILFLSTSPLIKIFVSLLYDYQDPIQLFIGSYFNYLGSDHRKSLFGALCALDICFWMIAAILFFNYINYMKENQLRLWLEISYEIPTKKNENYIVIGYSKKKNKEFWLKEDEFNTKFNKLSNIFILFTCIVFNLPILLNTFSFPFFIYFPVILIHLIHNSYYVFVLCEMICTLVFFLNVLNFFALKFTYINDKIKKLKSNNNQISINRKLSKLIYDFNYVYIELLKINDLFKHFIFINLTFYFILCVLASFLSILVDMNLRIGILTCLTFWFIGIIYFPFIWSENVLKKIKDTNKEMQNAVFYYEIDLENKKKINTIDYYLRNNKILTSSNLFSLNSFNCFQICLQIIIQIMMLIKVSGILQS